MQRQLPQFSDADRTVYSRLEELITGSDGLRWLELLNNLKSGSKTQIDEASASELVNLGVCTHGPGCLTLTEFGSKCADSAREYLFWVGRGRKIHGEGAFKATQLDNFRGKDVLDLGSGWGCNLVRLASVARRAIGIEIEPVYLEFSRILTKREGVPQPEIILANSEHTPCPPASFDWILIFSAIQYMDINRTFRECSRLLRPGGYLLIDASVLSRAVATYVRSAFAKRNPRDLLSAALMALNTLWYQAFGRRMRANLAGNSTARPIYPTKRFLIASPKKNGLEFRADLSSSLGPRWLFILQKTAAPS